MRILLKWIVLARINYSSTVHGSELSISRCGIYSTCLRCILVVLIVRSSPVQVDETSKYDEFDSCTTKDIVDTNTWRTWHMVRITGHYKLEDTRQDICFQTRYPWFSPFLHVDIYRYMKYSENPQKASCFAMIPHDTKTLDRFVYASDTLDYEGPVSLDRSWHLEELPTSARQYIICDNNRHRSNCGRPCPSSATKIQSM
jgi:hypothetical protein